MSQEQTVDASLISAVSMESIKFSFRKDKLGNRRAPVEIKAPVPNAYGLQQILNIGGKQLTLVLDAMADVVRSVGLDIVSDENIKSDNFPVDKLTWEAIANMSKEDRRSSSIPSERWEAFSKAYIEVMPGVSGRTTEQVTNAVEVYLKKFSICKTDKNVLKKLQVQLGIFMEQDCAEEFTDILELLTRRLETYLGADDVQAMLSNL